MKLLIIALLVIGLSGCAGVQKYIHDRTAPDCSCPDVEKEDSNV